MTQTIDQYIAAEMSGKIVKKANSPFAGVLTLVAGIALLMLMRLGHMGDSLQALVLTLGVLGTAVGLVLTAMTLSRALWHYHYVPTGKRMRDRKVYLGLDDYKRAADALSDGGLETLASLHPVTSSNAALRVLMSADSAMALVQAGRYDTGHFAPETPVRAVVGTEIAAVEALCR